MPPVPTIVSTRPPAVTIRKPGATNAGVLAAQILAVGDKGMAKKLEDYKKKLADKVEAAAAKLNAPTR